MSSTNSTPRPQRSGRSVSSGCAGLAGDSYQPVAGSRSVNLQEHEPARSQAIRGVIIVGATNNAAIIDAALLRSGRLEKHVEIPKPDTAALIGILRHYLGDDLASIVESAPLQFPTDGATAESSPATDPALPIATGNENPPPAKQTSTRKEAH